MTVLTTEQRKNLPADAFAIPETRQYPYRHLPGGPKTNRLHAINALARVAQNGSEDEQRRVAMAVHAEYPDLRARLKAAGHAS